MADRYILRATAGPSYDTATHVEVPVNRPEPVRIQSPGADIELNIRIRNYGGLPLGSPASSPYFDTAPHAKNNDQYSICFRFKPLKPPVAVENGALAGGDETDEANASSEPKQEGISGHDLQFGNDFDRPIRDKLPPGFNTAMGIVRWWIDPGLDGDAYADRPYLYGPALSSFNTIHIGSGECAEEKGGLWFEEGGDEEGMEARRYIGAPEDSKARMKWALKDDSKCKWIFEYGRSYGLDFFNPYLDFANLALNLPGFQLPIVKYWDGQGLRYVLRNKQTGETYLVVVFTIHLKDDVNEDGTLKEGAADRVAERADNYDARQEGLVKTQVLQQAEEQAPGGVVEETCADDVD
ncbi:uncharacterized protein MAM_06726 [Metarhizium album ARSEF 1941]|uniref:Domain of unknown function at the cortex 1 domain-containing protein n=1 Tax=Metarhizium album (strain ARSEF 1941) TaxID=1081103 RepID=A0A0B2WP45_METAS|nr:uncharacterized protein MAM_06726 [Metarhizium album ARSEF 1941]KHN95449.1 hypothetical protein MAM_06726 [Metarhizium album ARSEF 1941]